MTQYSPKQAMQLVGASSSTLRRWSDTFSRHLSLAATTAPRRYSDADLAVLRRIKSLLDAGLRLDDVDARLAEKEPLPPTEAPTEPPEGAQMALQPVTALLDTLQAQAATQQQMATTLAGLGALGEAMRQIADLRERVARLEAKIEQQDRIQDQIDSIGRYMHDHSGLARLGMHRVE